MDIDLIRAKIQEKFEELHQLNSAFTPATVDEDDVWYENLTDPEWKGKVPYGSLSNYLIFIQKKKDGYYLSLVVEAMPEMVQNDWLHGKPLKISDCNYEFSASALDVATNWSYDEAKPVWEEKLDV